MRECSFNILPGSPLQRMKSVSSIRREVLRKAIEHVVADVTLCSRHLQAGVTRQTIHVWMWNRNSLPFPSLWMLLYVVLIYFPDFVFLHTGLQRAAVSRARLGAKTIAKISRQWITKIQKCFLVSIYQVQKSIWTSSVHNQFRNFEFHFFVVFFCLPKNCLFPLPTWGWKLLAAARPSWERLNGSALKLAWAFYLDGREDGVMACWDD